MTSHRFVLLVAGACLTVSTLVLLGVTSAGMGPVLVSLGRHGLHQADVPVLMVWATGVGVLAWKWRRA